MGTNTLECSTTFHSYNIVKADFFQLVGLKATYMAVFNQDFNHQFAFMFTLIQWSTYFLLVRKIMLFSCETVVITQFDTCH